MVLRSDVATDGRRAARLVDGRWRRRTPTSTASSARSAGSSPTSWVRHRPTCRRLASATRSPGCRSGGPSGASASATPGRSCGSCRWPSPTSLLSRSSRTRSGRRSPGVGVRYASLGPWSGGSTAHLLMDSAGTDGGAAGETVIARGGPGALADALAGAVRAAGGEVRTGAEVVSITSIDGRATGVVLASGEELRARAVVGGIDPKRLLGGLVDPVTLGPSLSLAGGEHPDPRRRRQGQPRPGRGAPLHCGRRRRAARSGAGSSSRQASTRSSAPSTRASTAGSRIPSLSRR